MFARSDNSIRRAYSWDLLIIVAKTSSIYNGIFTSVRYSIYILDLVVRHSRTMTINKCVQRIKSGNKKEYNTNGQKGTSPAIYMYVHSVVAMVRAFYRGGGEGGGTVSFPWCEWSNESRRIFAEAGIRVVAKEGSDSVDTARHLCSPELGPFASDRSFLLKLAVTWLPRADCELILSVL